MCGSFGGRCAERQQAGGNEAFREYTENRFCDAVAASTISLHYTLKEPEKFGITEEKAVWGEAGQEPEAAGRRLKICSGRWRHLIMTA